MTSSPIALRGANVRTQSVAAANRVYEFWILRGLTSSSSSVYSGSSVSIVECVCVRVRGWG